MPRERRVVDERVRVDLREVQTVVARQLAHEFPREPGTDVREEHARADQQDLRRLRAPPLPAAVALEVRGRAPVEIVELDAHVDLCRNHFSAAPRHRRDVDSLY